MHFREHTFRAVSPLTVNGHDPDHAVQQPEVQHENFLALQAPVTPLTTLIMDDITFTTAAENDVEFEKNGHYVRLSVKRAHN